MLHVSPGFICLVDTPTLGFVVMLAEDAADLAEVSGSLFYGGGFRWTPMASRRFSPFAQFIFGGRKVTQEIDNLPLKT